MKKVRHIWEKIGFLRFRCTKCGCVKERVRDAVHMYFYYDEMGYSLPNQPNCKTTFNNDKFN